MKILIDMQGLQTPFSARRGVGVYIEGIVRQLGAARGHDVEFLFNAEFPDEYFRCLRHLEGIVTRENSHLFAQNIVDGYHSASEQKLRVAERYFAACVESLQPDVLFSPNLQEGLNDKAVATFVAHSARFVQVATLHDMVPMYMQDEYLSDPATRRWYSRKIADAAKCDAIVTVSETSKRDIQQFLGISRNVKVIPNGYDPDRFNSVPSPGERAAIAEFLRRDDDYIFYFGGADQHKNIARLVAAYASLPQELRRRFLLVLGGGDVASSAEVFQEINRHRLEKHVLIPGYVPENLLPSMLRQASLFVFPSIYEGFGLPALEAMACGTPTIGSATSGVGEVIANSEATFDPSEVSEIGRLIRRALESDSWRANLIAAGLKRAGKFSWRAAGEKLLDTFEEVHSRRAQSGRLSYLSKRVAEVVTTADRALARAAAVSIAETAPEERQARVYVDVSSTALYGGNSGIQRVVRQFARYLPQAFAPTGAQVEVVYAVEGTTEFRILSSVERNGSWVADPKLDAVVDISAGDVLLLVDLHPGLAIRMERRIQRMRALGVRVFHVVYDILPVLMPEKFWPELHEEFYRWLECVSRSDGLLCISCTVAKQTAEYLEQFGVKRPEPLLVGHFPLGSNFAQSHDYASEESPAEFLEQFPGLKGDQPKFLVVGTLEPRKAQEQTLLAFDQAWAEGRLWRLIFVGKPGWKVDRLVHHIREHPEFGRRLFWFENATDQMLRALYDLSDCVICPSEGEGFGLPLIEAAHAGKPVIARDIPVFREVAGARALYFDDDQSPAVIRAAIDDWQAARERGDESGSTGIRALTWAQSAEKFVSALSDEWPFAVCPRGAVDLRSPVSLASSNLRSIGMYPREGTFSWTAARAVIGFEAIETFDRVAVTLDCHSWREMPFDVLLDGQTAFSGSAGRDTTHFEFDLPGVRSGYNELQILCSAPGTPETDTRILGIAIHDLKMIASTAVTPDRWVNVRDRAATWRGFSEVQSGYRAIVGATGGIEFRVDGDLEATMALFVEADRPVKATFLLNGDKLCTQVVPAGAGTIELPTAGIRGGMNRLNIGLLSVGAPEEMKVFEFIVKSAQAVDGAFCEDRPRQEGAPA